MRLFIIHRFKDNKIARRMLKQLSKNLSLQLKPIFLDSSVGDRWKVAAERLSTNLKRDHLQQSHVMNLKTKWEIEEKVAQKIIEFHRRKIKPIARLISVYIFGMNSKCAFHRLK